MPSDFIASAHSDYPLPGHQAPLMANFLAQSAALAFGKTEAQARSELQAAGVPADKIAALLPHKVFAGNQPSTTLLLPPRRRWRERTHPWCIAVLREICSGSSVAR